MNTKQCSNCGRFYSFLCTEFPDGLILCDFCAMSAKEQEKIIKEYEKVSGFDPINGCTHCGVNQGVPLWEHDKDCQDYRPEPKNKSSIDCYCGGQSFMNNPALHHPKCPVYVYYDFLKKSPLNFNYKIQSSDDAHDYYSAIAEQEKQKEIEQITEAKKLALAQYLNSQTLNLKKKGDLGDFGFDWISPVVNPIEPAKPKSEPKEEVETIEKPKKRKINLD